MKRTACAIGLAVGIALMLGAVSGARADTITYNLTYTNSGDIGSGPFGTVTVDLTSGTTATVTFTAAAGYVFGDGSIADVNVNAASWTIGTFSSALLSSDGSKNVDGL